MVMQICPSRGNHKISEGTVMLPKQIDVLKNISKFNIIILTVDDFSLYFFVPLEDTTVAYCYHAKTKSNNER